MNNDFTTFSSNRCNSSINKGTPIVHSFMGFETNGEDILFFNLGAKKGGNFQMICKMSIIK